MRSVMGARSTQLTFARVATRVSAGRKLAMSVTATSSLQAQASRMAKPVFPFVKITGQADMKLGLILNIIDPALGGVLIMGDRGTGKSMSVRSLADILPTIDVVENDGYNSSPTNVSEMGPDARIRFQAGETLQAKAIKLPVIELPLGATEDRICGTIDIERALTEGVKAYEPGLLAKANRGILYVDEVNLLDDGLVDVVLDSAASGWNTVEREGVSVSHPARFIMVGSGSEEEGELRPQLLDRFGLSVQVRTIMNLDERCEMVEARVAYDKDPRGYQKLAAEESEALTNKLNESRARLNQVTLDPALSLKVSTVCSFLNVDGLRGDIVVNRCAKAHAAWEGRTEATAEDIARVIVMCLAHRLRKDPMEQMDGGYKVVLAYQKIFGSGAPKVKATPEAELIAQKEKEAKDAPPPPAAEKKAGAWDPSSLGR